MKIKHYLRLVKLFIFKEYRTRNIDIFILVATLTALLICVDLFKFTTWETETQINQILESRTIVIGYDSQDQGDFIYHKFIHHQAIEEIQLDDPSEKSMVLLLKTYKLADSVMDDLSDFDDDITIYLPPSFELGILEVARNFLLIFMLLVIGLDILILGIFIKTFVHQFSKIINLLSVLGYRKKLIIDLIFAKLSVVLNASLLVSFFFYKLLDKGMLISAKEKLLAMNKIDNYISLHESNMLLFIGIVVFNSLLTCVFTYYQVSKYQTNLAIGVSIDE